MPKIAAATVAEHRENVLAALVDASERILRAGDPLTAGVVSSAAGIARSQISPSRFKSLPIFGAQCSSHSPGPTSRQASSWPMR